jgi:uncharacterized protein YciI
VPLYVISWLDKPNSLQTRVGAREAHLDYIKAQGGKVKLGGPYLDEAGQMIGSLMVVEAESLDEAKAFHAQDPYRLAGLFESSSVTPWRATVGSL